MADAIRIEGLTQLSRSLRKIDADAPKALRVALNTGADVIVRAARPRMPRRTGRAAASLKAASTRTAVRITEGGRRAPYVPWLDFGGSIRLRTRRQVIKRPWLSEGRILYRSYYDHQDQLTEALERALLGVVRSAGLDG